MRLTLITIGGINTCFEGVRTPPPVRFRDGPLARHPCRRTGRQPGASAGHVADHATHPDGTSLALLVVPAAPAPHRLTAGPGGVVPDQQQRGAALSGALAEHHAHTSLVPALTGLRAPHRRHPWSAYGGPGRTSRPSPASAVGSGSSVGAGTAGKWWVTAVAVPPWWSGGASRLHQTSSPTPSAHVDWASARWIRRSRRYCGGDRLATERDLAAFKEGTIEVTETHAELVVNKQARMVEEVVIDGDVQEHTETVRDTVRRTDVDVGPLGKESTPRARDFSTYEREFRSHYDTTFAPRGAPYDRWAPAYRYGYDLATDPRYREREWATIEPDA
jgi:hypothetical protein